MHATGGRQYEQMRELGGAEVEVGKWDVIF